MKYLETHTQPCACAFCRDEIKRNSGYADFPIIMGRQITRTEIMEGLWIMYGEMVKLEKLSCPDFKRFPDTETILHYIEEKGLPPK